MEQTVLPIFLFVACALALALGLLIVAGLFNPGRSGRVTKMPYESGMDPIHDTRRRFDVRFYLLAVAFLVFDVELLFLYPWAVVSGQWSVASRQSAVERRQEDKETRRLGDTEIANQQPSPPLLVSLSPCLPNVSPGLPHPRGAAAVENRHLIFAGVMAFVALLTAGFIYDWRKGVFSWR